MGSSSVKTMPWKLVLSASPSNSEKVEGRSMTSAGTWVRVTGSTHSLVAAIDRGGAKTLVADSVAFPASSSSSGMKSLGMHSRKPWLGKDVADTRVGIGPNRWRRPRELRCANNAGLGSNKGAKIHQARGKGKLAPPKYTLASDSRRKSVGDAAAGGKMSRERSVLPKGVHDQRAGAAFGSQHAIVAVAESKGL